MKPIFLWDAYRLEGPGSGIFTYVQKLAQSFATADEASLIVGSEKLSRFFPPGQKFINPSFRPSRLSDSKIIWPHRIFHELSPKLGISLWHGMANINLPFLAAKKKIRFVLTVHDLIPLLPASGCSLSYQLQFRYGLSRALRYADAVVAVSNWTGELLLQRFGVELKNKLYVISNGATFSARKVTKKKPSSTFQLLCLSRNEPYKELELLPKILRLLPKSYRLVLVSNESGAFLMKKVAADLMLASRLEVQTKLTDLEMDSLWQSSDLYLHPSRYEGFGLPVYEALAHSCPVIFRAGHAFDGIIPEDLGLGLGGEEKDWAQAIEERAALGREDSFASRCQEFFHHIPTWQDAAISLKKLYNSLV